MNQTRQDYITEQHQELEAEGLKPIDYLNINFDDEYYSLLENHLKQGGTITQEIYNSLTSGQQYHFNKHYNFRGDKIINSDYQQAIEEGKKQAEINANEFLTQKQKNQEIKEQKEKQNIKRKLMQELEQLQNNLFDYNSLSPIGRRNISKYDHDRKQTRIKERITELQEQIKMIV